MTMYTAHRIVNCAEIWIELGARLADDLACKDGDGVDGRSACHATEVQAEF